MSNDVKWSIELVQRCEAVGWDVRKPRRGGHWTVRIPGGGQFTFSTTTRNGKAIKNALADAKRHGLLDAEERLKQQRNDERQKAIHDDRKKVEVQIQSMTADNEDVNSVAKKLVATGKGTLGYVDGVAIVERAPAKYKGNNPNVKGLMTAHNASEVLLDDGRVVYTCNLHSCTYFADKAVSVVTHQARSTFHQRTKKTIAAYEELQNNGVTAKDSNVIAEAFTTFTDTNIAQANHKQPGEDEASSSSVIAVLATEVDEIAGRLGVIAEQIKNLAEKIDETRPDEETASKAKKYDQIKGMLNE